MRNGPMNIHGRTFGSLTAIDILKRRASDGSVNWQWKCSCGRKISRSFKVVIESKEHQCCHKCEKHKVPISAALVTI